MPTAEIAVADPDAPTAAYAIPNESNSATSAIPLFHPIQITFCEPFRFFYPVGMQL
jgi:hypothetical protein